MPKTSVEAVCGNPKPHAAHNGFAPWPGQTEPWCAGIGDHALARVEAARLRAEGAVAALKAGGWQPHWGMHCWYKGKSNPNVPTYGLPGEFRVTMTDEEREVLYETGA